MELERLIDDLRVRGSDNPTVEVKSAAAGLPDSVTVTMCAMANMPGGGLIILGLDESSGFVPVGLRTAATLAAGLASRARQAFDPPIQLSVDVESFEGSDIVVARVREVPVSAKPCIVKRTGQAYLRFSDGDYTLSRLEIDGFVANRARPRFDEAEVDGSSVGDLEMDRVADFVATARAVDRRLAAVTDDRELLRKVGVVSTNDIPTVAGLLALGSYPQQFLPHCNVRAAYSVDGDSSVRALDSGTFTGPIAALLDDTVRWIARNSRTGVVSDPATGQVATQLDPPPIATRELVANALVHRDLAEWASSRSVEIRMTNELLRVTNPGGLYGITVDRLGTHPLTSARNRRLVEICKFVRTDDANVVEALASGIPATVAALRHARLPDPEFFDQALAFTVLVRRGRNATSADVRADVRLTVAERAVLQLLDSPMTVEGIAASLGISRNAVHKRLASLRAKGLVDLSGGNGQRSMYRRTSAG